VWDWRTGELLFVRHNFYLHHSGFLDDYRLLVYGSTHGGPLGLLLLDTERAPPVVPTETWFYRSRPHRPSYCSFELGGYQPSPQDILAAPFYPDPSQRILVLPVEAQSWFYVIKVETLLKLARERAGEGIEWEDWEPFLIRTATPGTPDATHDPRSWVSGFRLFSSSIAVGDDRLNLHVYDFSPHARMKFLHMAGDGCRVVHPSVTAWRLPWDPFDICDISVGHDSMLVQLYTTSEEDAPNAAPDIDNL